MWIGVGAKRSGLRSFVITRSLLHRSALLPMKGSMAVTSPRPAPVPCVRISTETLHVAGPTGYWDEVVAPVVELRFDYSNGGPSSRGRDARAEAAARALLEQHGAIELDGFEDCATEPGS